MEVVPMREHLPDPLRQEIFLQINERLYTQGIIPKSLYEQAKTNILTR